LTSCGLYFQTSAENLQPLGLENMSKSQCFLDLYFKWRLSGHECGSLLSWFRYDTKEKKLFPAGNWATDNQVCHLLTWHHRCSKTLGGVQDDSGCGGEITHIYVMHEGANCHVSFSLSYNWTAIIYSIMYPIYKQNILSSCIWSPGILPTDMWIQYKCSNTVKFVLDWHKYQCLYKIT